MGCYHNPPGFFTSKSANAPAFKTTHKCACMCAFADLQEPMYVCINAYDYVGMLNGFYCIYIFKLYGNIHKQYFDIHIYLVIYMCMYVCMYAFDS